ncbi:hypothetical protein [Amycolatopsis sp. WQ 127309]|uniref:hypothetical protein n=1 Tax=Amycolatopsis sp. WQ 127309 TaxID=2932773 RepID=UPI001FF5D2F9|nr:hypothetical protein [Amycolatopsis sp. WQ 127309]UOZ09386.1 hypothetical protein MUY22_14385 [Amycolatopsis sp. WQ 127309]
MNPNMYLAAWGAAGRYAAAPVPRPFHLSRGLQAILPAERNAIYVACTRDGVIDYVGSTRRTAHTRAGEHVRKPSRGKTWDTLWVIPLRESTPEGIVRQLEGRVGRLLRPASNRRLPRS